MMLLKFTDTIKSRDVIRTKENLAIIQEDVTSVRDCTDSIGMKSSSARPCSYGQNKDSCFSVRVLQLKNDKNH